MIISTIDVIYIVHFEDPSQITYINLDSNLIIVIYISGHAKY